MHIITPTIYTNPAQKSTPCRPLLLNLGYFPPPPPKYTFPFCHKLSKCFFSRGRVSDPAGILHPASAPTETIFITGYKAEVMDRYLAGKPECGKTRIVLQSDPQGLGQAISLALPYTNDDDPLLIILGDTLFCQLPIFRTGLKYILFH